MMLELDTFSGIKISGFEPIRATLGSGHERSNKKLKSDSTLAGLRCYLMRVWNNIPQADIRNLVNNMQRQCDPVIAAEGGHTRY